MDFGVAVRSFRSLFGAVTNAAAIDAQSIQLAMTNLNTFEHASVDKKSLALLAKHIKKMIPGRVIIHAPYQTNFATTEEGFFAPSKASVLDALERAACIDANYVVVHIGNHRGIGMDNGIKQVQSILTQIIAETDSPAELVLEMGVGGRTNVGSRFEEIAQILDGIPDIAEGIGLCIDTAHLWGAGYKIDTSEDVDNMFCELDKYVGIEKLKIIHLNDTLMGLGFNHDRHYDIGKGNIGSEGFRAIINYEKLPPHIPGIIETPPGDSKVDDERNINMLRSLVEEKEPAEI